MGSGDVVRTQDKQQHPTRARQSQRLGIGVCRTGAAGKSPLGDYPTSTTSVHEVARMPLSSVKSARSPRCDCHHNRTCLRSQRRVHLSGLMAPTGCTTPVVGTVGALDSIRRWLAEHGLAAPGPCCLAGELAVQKKRALLARLSGAGLRSGPAVSRHLHH